jgi:hypothetical protein
MVAVAVAVIDMVIDMATATVTATQLTAMATATQLIDMATATQPIAMTIAIVVVTRMTRELTTLAHRASNHTIAAHHNTVAILDLEAAKSLSLSVLDATSDLLSHTPSIHRTATMVVYVLILLTPLHILSFDSTITYRIDSCC